MALDPQAALLAHIDASGTAQLASALCSRAHAAAVQLTGVWRIVNALHELGGGVACQAEM